MLRLGTIRAGIVIVFACLLMGGTLSISAAQSVSTTSAVEKLERWIHISADRATLESIAVQLSEQTGLHIEAAPYLRGHRSTIHFTGDANTLLGTLAELNGWGWHEERDGRIVISRTLGRNPRSIREVPAAIQKVMAKDVRRYPYVDKEDKIVELNPEHNFFLRMPAHPNSPLTDAYNRVEARHTTVRTNVNSRADTAIAYSVNTLVETLKPTAPEHKAVKYTQLTDWQRSLLIARHMLRSLKMLIETETYDVTYNCLKPYYLDNANLEVYLSGRDSIKDTILFDWTTMENGEPISLTIGQQIDPKWLEHK